MIQRKKKEAEEAEKEKLRAAKMNEIEISLMMAGEATAGQSIFAQQKDDDILF